MPVSDCELTQMFEHVLSLSKVDATQSVAVLKSHYSNPRTVRAAMEAAQRWGPRITRKTTPAKPLAPCSRMSRRMPAVMA